MRALVTCTYPNDYGWLRHAAKSIERFLTGFDRWFVWAPLPVNAAVTRVAEEYRGKVPLTVKWFDEWPEKGFCHHEWIIVNSDALHDDTFDTFTNWDSDTVLCKPMDALQFFAPNGKPYLPSGDKAAAIACNPTNGLWYLAVEKAIGILPTTHGMKWMPITYRRDTLQLTRKLIQAHTGKSAEEYIRSCKNSYPQTFAEFNTISCVAEVLQPGLYLPSATPPWESGTLQQFWSHGGLDRRMDSPILINGKTYETPRQLIGDLGFL